MSTTLIFKHDGWDVATASWTAASKNGSSTVICYTWGPDGISFFDNRVSTARIEYVLPFDHFLSLVRKGGIVDMRGRP